MSENQQPARKSGTDQGFTLAVKAFLVGALRLLIILLLGVVIGVGVYLGIPQLYRSFIQPVRDNAADIAELKALQQQNSDLLIERVNDLQSRLDGIEVQQDTDREAIAELQSELAQAKQALSELSDSLTTDAGNLASLETRLDDLQSELGDVGDSLNELDGKIIQNQASIQALGDFLDSQETPVAALRRELQLVKAMELLTRSRLFLSRNNIGLAEDDIQSARVILADLQTLVLPYQEDALNAILARIDLALENINDNSALAVEDLEVAWRLLVEGLPGEPALAGDGAESTGEATGETGSAEATPTVSETTQATETPTPTATP